MFVTIRCACRNQHEWDLLLPKYFFSIKDATCPECEKPVVSMKAGEPKSLEEITASPHLRNKR